MPKTNLYSAYLKSFVRKVKEDPVFANEEAKRIEELYSFLAEKLANGKLEELNMMDVAPFAGYLTKKMVNSSGEPRENYMMAVIENRCKKKSKLLPNGSQVAEVAAVCMALEEAGKGAEFWTKFKEYNPVYSVVCPFGCMVQGGRCSHVQSFMKNFR